MKKVNIFTVSKFGRKLSSLLRHRCIELVPFRQINKSTIIPKSSGDSTMDMSDYPFTFTESTDVITKELIDIGRTEPICGLKNLVNVIRTNECNINVRYACEAIVVTYNMKVKSLQNQQFLQLIENDETVREMFRWLLNLIMSKPDCVSDDILARVLFGTRMFKFDARIMESLENLLDEYLRRLPTSNFNSLSYVSACVRTKEFNYLNRQTQVLHNTIQLLPQCHLPDQLKSIAICIKNLRNLVSDAVISQFYQKLIAISEKNDDWPADAVISCLSISLLPRGSISEEKKVVKLLLKKTRKLIPELSVTQLSTLNANMKHVKDDAVKLDIEKEISQRALELIDNVSHPIEKFELLCCLDSTKLHQFESAKNILKTSHPHLYMPYYLKKIFAILNRMKSFDTEFINTILSDSKTYLNKRNSDYVLKLTKGYVKLLLNSSNIYRHEKFEKEVQFVLLDLLHESWGWSAVQVAAAGAFFLLTCRNEALPVTVVERILAHAHHFESGDITTISKCLKWSFRDCKNFSERHSQLLSIRNKLNKETNHHLDNVISLNQLTQLTAGLLYRSKPILTNLLHNAMDKHHNFLNEFTSSNLIDTCRNIIAGRFYAPDILDRMVEWVLKNPNRSSSCLPMLLSACYRVGYFPQHGETFFDHCTDVLKKDYNNMPGVQILLASLALNLYGRFPTFLINFIFSEKFLDILEREIEGFLYFDFAFNARFYFMLVNRIVCLEYPEYGIPWFHDKYCQERKFFLRSSSINKQIEDILCQLLGGKSYYKRDVPTPYYYYLSFECLLDSNGRPTTHMPYNANYCDESMEKFERIAINLLTERDYCSNVNQLLGHAHLNRRHLEIMGYEVVEIPYFQWQDSCDQFRKEMLSNKIFGMKKK